MTYSLLDYLWAFPVRSPDREAWVLSLHFPERVKRNV